MPLQYLRVCGHCNAIRYAACGIACKVPPESDPANWRTNLQEGAGTLTIPIPLTPATPA